jgi:hypothetical protein
MLPTTPAPRHVSRGARAVSLAVLCALALLGAPLLIAHAATPATLTVTLQTNASTATQSQYQAIAAGFAAQTQLTITLGDGTGVAPLTGKTDAAGGFTSWWTLVATNKYCATLSASDGTNTASASFWVAPTTDSQSGTACTGAATGPVSTPLPTVAPTQTAATPIATKAAQPAPSTVPAVPTGSSLGARVQRVIARIPGGLATVIGASVVAILLLLGLIALLMLGRNRPADAAREPMRGMPPGRGGMSPPGMPTRRTPAAAQSPSGYHPYEWDAGAMDNDAGGAPGAGRAQRAEMGAQRNGAAPPGTLPPWVGDPGNTPGRTGSYRMPGNRSGRHPVPSPMPAPRWDRGRPGARSRRDEPPARTLRDAAPAHDDWPPDPDLR